MFGCGMNRKHRPAGKFLIFLLAASLFLVVVGGVVTLLWNAILPDLLGLKPITYWQALGLLLLARIFFGSYGWKSPRSRWSGKRRTYWKEKWASMSDEEKAAFKARWRDRCK